MIRATLVVSALFVAAALPAATISTNLLLKATATLSGTSVTFTGSANLTNVGNGTFSATLPQSSLSGGNVTVPFTIALDIGGGASLSGNLTFPGSLATGGATSGSCSATITRGTGIYAGMIGSFPNMSAASVGSVGTNDLAVSFSGLGVIATPLPSS